MRTEVVERVKLALASGINLPLLEYLQAKLSDTVAHLIVVNDLDFKRTQGKAQELEELIKLVKSVRE